MASILLTGLGLRPTVAAAAPSSSSSSASSSTTSAVPPSSSSSPSFTHPMLPPPASSNNSYGVSHHSAHSSRDPSPSHLSATAPGKARAAAGTSSLMLDPMPPNPAYDLPPLPIHPLVHSHSHSHSRSHSHKSTFRRISSKLRLTRSSAASNPNPSSSFGHSTRPSTASASASTPRKPIPPLDRESAVTHFLDLLPHDSPIATRPHVEHAFAATGWFSEDAALEYLEDWSDAYMGALHPVDRRIHLLGIENSGNTCFIDSLLFALFARMEAVDAWVTQSLGMPGADQQPPPPDVVSPDAHVGSSQPASPLLPSPPTRPPSPATVRRASLLRAVQTHLTLLATRLRKGHLVTRSEIRTLEVVIKQLWAMEGTNAGRLGEQEDVAELFLMLASCLRAPCLPLWQVIHHGGAIEDRDDKRVCTERCLQLAIPEPKARAPVALEELLEKFFFDNKVTLLRKVQRDAPAAAAAAAMGTEDSDELRMAKKAQVEERWRLGLAPRSASSFSVNQRERGGEDGEAQVEDQMVDAWSTFKLMPFLVGENESGEHSDVLLGDNSPILIPICLKRYYQKEGKSTLKRTSRPVLLPIEIGFDQFTAAEAATFSSSFSTMAEPATPRYSLVLQSVICHLGETPTSGHFITYVNASALPPGSMTHSLPQRAPHANAQAGQTPRSALSTAPSSPAVKPTRLPIAETASTTSPALGTHRPPGRVSSPPPPPPYSPALPPWPGGASAAASSSAMRDKTTSPRELTRSFSADTMLYAARSGAQLPDVLDASDDTSDADVAAAVDDPSPTWLRFDGLGPVGGKVQPYTSTMAITRQLTDEIAKNAYLVFYELRRVVPPAAPAVAVHSPDMTEPGLDPGSPVAEAAEVGDARAPPTVAGAAHGRQDPRPAPAAATAKPPKHVRRHSVAGGAGADADLALALKMQAKEAAKQKRAEGSNCLVM